MKTKYIFLAIILILSTILTACGGKEEQQTSNDINGDIEEKGVLQVYTTIFPLMDFAKKIGGEHTEVKNLVPVGADAHSFEPTPKTMVDVSNADLYIYNGAGIEGFADAVVAVLKTGTVKIIKATEGIDLIGFDHDDEDDEDSGRENDEQGHEDDEEGHDDQYGEGDPHVWLDPIRSIELAENIKNALVELMPEAAADFESNFAVLKQQLEGLDEKFKAMVDEVSRDTIIVSHAGYGYWTDRYNIKQVGISGISPTNEPSIRQLTEIIEYAEAQNINYVMFEQNIPTNIAETVRSQVGAEDLRLHNLEVLVQDDIENNEDYFSLMEKNIEQIRIALQ